MNETIYAMKWMGVLDLLLDYPEELDGRLRERDAHILKCRMTGKTLASIAKDLPRMTPEGGIGVSRSLVKDLEARGCSRLLHPSRRKQLIQRAKDMNCFNPLYRGFKELMK